MNNKTSKSILLIFLIGVCVLLYPSVSNWRYEQTSGYVIRQYSETVQSLPAYDKEEQLRLAKEYNDALTGYNIRDPFIPGSGIVLPDNYTSVLNMNGTMAYLTIPKINISLPIRHGTGEDALQKGAGHIEATAFPIGGESTHCVLTAHRGLADAKLFSDLDLLVVGDVFLLYTMDDALCYQVDQILVVEPEDVDALRPIPGEDYCTLITCTPYAVNSHRLMVRGTRVPYSPEGIPEEIQEMLQRKALDRRTVIVTCFVALWTALLTAYTIAEQRNNSKRSHLEKRL